MIKPEELRIGNVVRRDGVYGYLLNDAFPITANGLKQFSDGILSFDPVPLTEEWLIKFGLTIENTVGGYLKWEIRTSKGRIIRLLDKKFTWGAGEYSDYILYVHQLQNLYYALTGEELTISEPTKQSEG